MARGQTAILGKGQAKTDPTTPTAAPECRHAFLSSSLLTVFVKISCPQESSSSCVVEAFSAILEFGASNNKPNVLRAVVGMLAVHGRQSPGPVSRPSDLGFRCVEAGVQGAGVANVLLLVVTLSCF